MKPIVAKDQVRLGVARCWQLAVSGMSHRMFRSGVTMAILALASAFVVHMLSYGIIQHASEQSAERELRASRRVGQNITRLSAADVPAVIVTALLTDDASRVAEYQRWGRLTKEELATLRRVAARVRQASLYLDALPVAARAVVVGDRTAEEVLDQLTEPKELDAFFQQLGELSLPPPLGSHQALRDLVQQELPELRALLVRIKSGHTQACATLAFGLRGSTVTPSLIGSDPQLADALTAAGFGFSKAELAQMQDYARTERDRGAIQQSLLRADVAGAVARGLAIDLAKVSFDTLASEVDSPKRAEWLTGLLRPLPATAHLSRERLDHLLSAHQREARLGRVTRGINPLEKPGFLGLSERNQWLAILSFLVCAVGVANAMLMSVTERFTEIATMKCLGAMDRFVMAMFVLEALIQGAVGGVIGLLLGVLLALLRARIEFGSLVYGALGAAAEVGLAMVISLGLGIGLAALAAVGPAWVAARLAPMEAMRVE